MNSDFINIAAIVKDSVVDGPGVRTTLFVQGCEHACPKCHNPELQGVGGYMIDVVDLAYELANINNNVTLSGGEPMLQAKLLTKTIRKMQSILNSRYESLARIWCYTGFTWEQIMNNADMKALIKWCDVVVDGKFVEQLKDPSLKFRGSSNQRIIDVQESLKTGGIVLYEK